MSITPAAPFVLGTSEYRTEWRRLNGVQEPPPGMMSSSGNWMQRSGKRLDGRLSYPAAATGQPATTGIKFSNWLIGAQAAPSTVQPLNPILLNLFSDNRDNYTSTTSGQKVVFKLTSPRVFAATDKWLFASKGSIVLTVSKSYPGVVPASTQLYADGYIRLTAITADFDPTTVTWNSIPSLTTGAPLLETRFAECRNFNGNIDAGGVLDGSATAGALPFTAGSSGATVYGLLVEVKCTDDAYAPTSVYAQGTIDMASTGVQSQLIKMS